MNLQEIKTEIYKLPEPEIRELYSYLGKALQKAEKSPKLIDKEAKERFLKRYYSLFKTHYYWTGKDAGSLRQILNKIHAKYTEQFPEFTDADVVNGFDHFVAKVYEVSNDWIRQHFTLAIINQQFNALYTQIKNGKANISDDYKQKLFNDLHA
ncbi:hypothetical protein LJC16_02215 [Bacteroidales bacterium OttesenSCG-928-C19]|nr:hypothetical protein [Bacteroidales bacterium OttesenSCG-928-C19]